MSHLIRHQIAQPQAFPTDAALFGGIEEAIHGEDATHANGHLFLQLAQGQQQISQLRNGLTDNTRVTTTLCCTLYFKMQPDRLAGLSWCCGCGRFGGFGLVSFGPFAPSALVLHKILANPPKATKPAKPAEPAKPSKAAKPHNPLAKPKHT